MIDDPERYQGGITTTPMYEDAALFRDVVMGLDDETDISITHEVLRTTLKSMNNASSLRGYELRITSPIHHVDWSRGEATEYAGRIAVEEVAGTFEGKFIGYLIVPVEDELSGRLIPGLAVVMDTTIIDPDVDAIQVLVVSPVFPSDIELI